jgi:hypothetical protein
MFLDATQGAQLDERSPHTVPRIRVSELQPTEAKAWNGGAAWQGVGCIPGLARSGEEPLLGPEQRDLPPAGAPTACPGETVAEAANSAKRS